MEDLKIKFETGKNSSGPSYKSFSIIEQMLTEDWVSETWSIFFWVVQF